MLQSLRPRPTKAITKCKTIIWGIATLLARALTSADFRNELLYKRWIWSNWSKRIKIHNRTGHGTIRLQSHLNKCTVEYWDGDKRSKKNEKLIQKMFNLYARDRKNSAYKEIGRPEAGPRDTDQRRSRHNNIPSPPPDRYGNQHPWSHCAESTEASKQWRYDATKYTTTTTMR